ncbi:16S rRNA (cytidine(1402)-2'-O)-methyltransferase [Patescibacteria group bacterium]|nr:16S rRNA (cytidine(1402)-2'-O)-methyltransferase [Patescibacteria group bacterium]MCG2687783.1 16S rRNA (cytidine(1402)-2'-O)-methyltransferase [Candidatus Parcubacteria bacterium]
MQQLNNKYHLYVVATPIGNLEDCSNRMIEILKTVDLIACEDTRVTKKLLNHFGIGTPVTTYHQHSSDSIEANIVEKIKSGMSVALVTDAGTPGISDPGGKLVEACVQAGIEVSPIPGPSAIITALSASGFPTDRFCFLGFPPNKKGRLTYFKNLAEIDGTVVFYESTHRIEKTLQQVPQDRRMVVGRELTKMHEHIYRGTAQEIITQLANTSSKGEFVIVLAPRRK